MGKKKVLVKVHPEGKHVVDIAPGIDISTITPNCRVALRNDYYTLHKVLPNKIDPLVSLMMVEKVPDSTYDMVGGLDKQIKEIKEVWPTAEPPNRLRSSSFPLSIPNSSRLSVLPSLR